MDIQLNKKLETINGVSGDAAHDLKIIGEGNIEIANNESKNQIMVKVPNVVDVDHAKEADHATKADLATQATSAEEAADAENAVNAEEADHAKKADYATRAGEADVAYDATRATTAETASRAISADNSDRATNASNAEYAEEAMHASFADQATEALRIGKHSESDFVDTKSDQIVSGEKTFSRINFPNNGLNAVFDGIYADSAPTKDQSRALLTILDSTSYELGMFQLVHYSNGQRELRFRMTAKNLDIVYATILKIDANGNIL